MEKSRQKILENSLETMSDRNERYILDVDDVIARLRALLKKNVPYLRVRGEIVNLSRSGSGHMYFSLRGHEELLQCVWFKARQFSRGINPFTGEVLQPEDDLLSPEDLRDGQTVICSGGLSLYGSRSVCQLIADLVQADGLGKYRADLMILQRKLQDRGYFLLERKRAIPANPQTVALITSPGSAAAHDFLSIAQQRGTGSKIFLYPVLVQGEDAPADIAAAIAKANTDNFAEVIALVRGGGSNEDLRAFDDERVASAIFASAIPVVAGIGHEINTSLADMTADLRAATPTHAAQLIWTDRSLILSQINELKNRSDTAIRKRLRTAQTSLLTRESHLKRLDPGKDLAQKKALVHSAAAALRRAMSVRILHQKTSLDRLEAALTAASPLKGISAASGKLRFLHALLQKANPIPPCIQKLDLLQIRLQNANPLAPLMRGYAMVHQDQGAILQSARDILPGSILNLRFHDGSLRVQVLPKTE
ncbi:MAG: exodeoxyribonuclease VII large subunit [Desulfovibrionaceae bacterium]|nr:exodeoxyribonuclease VII large subunit [Desulfovibrionaceae bacterium]